MALRVVFDSNVLISGLVFGGVPGRCLDLVEAGTVECIVCTAILKDVTEKLASKFGHDDLQLGDEIAWLVQHSTIQDPAGELHGLCRDPDDDVVIECALIAAATHVVTGDLDLLNLGRYQSVEIISPERLIRMVAG